MNNTDLYKIVRHIVKTVTACPAVIMADPNATAPTGEYCAIKVTGVKEQYGRARTETSNTEAVDSPIGEVYDVSHEVSVDVIAHCTINFYRGNANDYAKSVFGANMRPDISEFLFVNKVGWMDSMPINDLTALQANSWESRSQIVIKLSYVETSTVITNAIYQIPVIATDETGTVIDDETIEYPNP